jgi:hypothetical protein
MPPGPHTLHVRGEVFAGNPGLEAFLTVTEPQGIVPNILFLDLHTFQRPGIWPQHTTWVPAAYEKVPSPNYTDVEIFEGGTSIARIKVERAD